MKHQAVDLTALLDVILIILFAVLLNMQQSAQAANQRSSDQGETLATLNSAYLELESELSTKAAQNTTLLDEISTLRASLDDLSQQTLEDAQTQDALIAQYNQLFDRLTDMLAQDSNTIKDIAEAQNLSDAEAQARLEAVTDTNILMENLHKYETIANTFAFIDITFDLSSGEVIMDGTSSGVFIQEEDGLDDHLFQLKRDDVSAYLITALNQQDINQSFILITIKFDPYITKRYYISIVTEAIDQMRETYQEKVIFDTIYLTK